MINKCGCHIWIYSCIRFHQMCRKICFMNFCIFFLDNMRVGDLVGFQWQMEVASEVTRGWEATPGVESMVTTAPVTIRIQEWQCQCQLLSQEIWCQAGWSLGQDTWQAYQRSNNIWNILTAVEGGWGENTESYLKISQSKSARLVQSALAGISAIMTKSRNNRLLVFFWAVCDNLLLRLTSILS